MSFFLPYEQVGACACVFAQLFDNKVGVAFFHPNWNFEELEQEDATHFERRAPFPTVSLLRKDDIGVIVQDFLVQARPPPANLSPTSVPVFLPAAHTPLAAPSVYNPLHLTSSP